MLSGTVVAHSIACGSLMAENRGPVPVTFEFEQAGEAGIAPAPEAGYVPFPEGIVLECRPKSVVVPGHASVPVEVTARLAVASLPAGKYQGTVRSRATRGSASVNLMNKVLVTVSADPCGDGGKKRP